MSENGVTLTVAEKLQQEILLRLGCRYILTISSTKFQLIQRSSLVFIIVGSAGKWQFEWQAESIRDHQIKAPSFNVGLG